MKTTKFKLFATMITLVAVITGTTIPTQAQRRSTRDNTPTRSTTSKNNERSKVQKKSTFKNYDQVSRKSVNRNLKSTRSQQNKPSRVYTNNSTSRQRSNNNAVKRDNYRKSNATAYRSDRTNNNRSKASAYSNNTRNNIANREVNRPIERTTNRNRDFYRTDKNDRRYTPSKNYRGSDRYWSNNMRPEMRSNKSHGQGNNRNFNYNSHKHWDRNWEHYRWNHNSWHDYYTGYNPRSYMYYKYYYHHPRYGHVIRRFDFRPSVFVHNHHNYYCYNGHFFRYMSGIGYVLVDMPFGFTFEVLPYGYEQVYINGYLYFRVGNLFFEFSNNRFHLVHYPERYYAFDSGYNNYGYRFYDNY